jgi:hypothetical protein
MAFAGTGCAQREGRLATGSLINSQAEFLASDVDSGMTPDVSGYARMQEFPSQRSQQERKEGRRTGGAEVSTAGADARDVKRDFG